MATRRDAGRSDLPADMVGLGRAYFDFGAQVWQSSLKIGAGYVMRAVDRALRLGPEPWPPRDLAQDVILGLRNCWAELAMVVPFSLQRVSLELDRQAIGQAAVPSVRNVGGREVLLPARIREASQGWAVYFVAADRLRHHLGERAKQFAPVDVGGGRTPVIIFGIDHRESDLGTYHEIAVALLVRPRRDPSPGLLFLSLAADEEFSVEAARTIWGDHKLLAKRMAASYAPAKTTFSVAAGSSSALSVAFPRFGSGRVTDMPICVYSIMPGGPQAEGTVHKMVTTKSTSGAGIQFGGAVELRLGDPTQGDCICHLGPGGGDQACICRVLQDLGVAQRRPAANGWSEHMSGTLGPPLRCGAP